jgi:penicillin-binding protein 2
MFPRIFSRGKGYYKQEIDPEDVFLDSSNLSDLDTHQMQGQLEAPLAPRLRIIFGAVTVIVLFVFGGKLFSMQILEGKAYAEKANDNHVRSIPLFANRGTIEDSKGKILAWNEEDFISGTTTIEIPRRVYTSLSGLSHVLGYVSYPKKDKSGVFWQDEYVGKDGVEKIYQDELQGIPGQKLVAVSARHEVKSENVIVQPKPGQNLKLTIDADVQHKLYESMASLAKKVGFSAGAGVIMDVHTGEILAITSYPEYNNNVMTNATSSKDKARIEADLKSSSNKFLNRAVSGLFVPGSTVKPFVAYAALAEDVITPEKQILSTGALVIKNKYGGPDTVFKDWKAHGYVNMRQAIAQSSDEYFYQVGGGFGSQKGLGILKIDEYAKMFGFGTTTGIDLPNEKSGVIPTPEWKKKVFGEDWLLGNTYHTSIGQFGFQLTPLELVRSVASIANGGYLVTPHVVRGAVTTQSIPLNLNKEHLKVIQEGMRMGTLEGTVKGLNISGVTVAGKSGTAELGITKELVNSWISGYFPYENPKYAFVVMMEKGSRHNLTGAVFAMRETLEWMRDNTDYTK